MTRDQLEHALRAVQTVTGESEFVIIGSQAILGQFPDAPEDLLVSQEIDIYAPAKPEASDLIQGACGEHTDFPRTHDFYVDGVSPTTAVVPGGWRNRATGWCLEVHDIAVAKYFANREKDRRYPTSPPAGAIEAFPRSEYPDRAGPQDFTAGVRLTLPRPARSAPL